MFVYVSLHRVTGEYHQALALLHFLRTAFRAANLQRMKDEDRDASAYASRICARERVDIKSASNLNIATCRGDLHSSFKS